MIPGLGRSPGERKGYPLQYSALKNSTDCIVRGVAKSQTQLSNIRMPQKKNEILLFAAMWMDLKNTILSEVRQRQILHMIYKYHLYGV